ncbi:ABC transporter ATP-binding protein [Planosporangium mesophilum]|uniref:ABC transporter ATP-binding protein n=1 Tax=Planosporangium mesophilum TaxID=689768 RepID=A0A8J3X268_9ACTN|nr:ABC transporter ATP-binding protein [Planosporangium mesophilum]
MRDVDLDIAHGERVLLLGPSGGGKSTLLAALAGLLADSGEQAGEITVDGLPPADARSRVGILFQDPETQLVMRRAGDDVAFGLENRGVPAERIWPRVRAALERVGFGYPLDRDTASLSGGEQQRLALAGVLALEPSLLLLDEPTANLDPDGAALVRQTLDRSLRGDRATLVLVEHRVAEALPLVDRVVALSPGGGVLADGPPDEVLRRHGDALAALGVWVPDAEPVPRRTRPTAPPGPMLLTARQLGYRYPDSPAPTRSAPERSAPALAGVDAEVGAGEAVAVRGPNGAGKSTLALLLGGLLPPSSGAVVASTALAGRYAGRPPHRWRAAVLAERIGSVFQNPEHQFLAATVHDELALGPRRAGHPAADVAKTVDDLLERLHLAHLAEANPHTLSGGERRRLSVATALAAAPRVVILDEPTFGQDLRTWTELLDLLSGLRDDGTAVVAVTHDADFVAALADRCLDLERPA